MVIVLVDALAKAVEKANMVLWVHNLKTRQRSNILAGDIFQNHLLPEIRF